MSRVYEALQRANPELGLRVPAGAESMEGSQLVAALSGESAALDQALRFEIPTAPSARLIAWTQPSSLGAEKMRVLTARYRQLQQRRSAKVLLVTSPVRGDGKSTISLNLAITFATQGEKTLLIDGDLHRSALAETLAVNGESGLANWCERLESDQSFFHRAESLPLWFLPAGSSQEQPLTILQSAEAGRVMKQLTNWFTRIVIDSPPLVPLADSNVWLTMSDAVLLVARDGVTPRKALIKSLESLDKSKLFAVVMNDGYALDQRYYSDYYRNSEPAQLNHKAAAAP